MGLIDFSVGDGDGVVVFVVDGLGVPLLSHAELSPLMTTSVAAPATSGRRTQRRNRRNPMT